jgi:hypothetical protein
VWAIENSKTIEEFSVMQHTACGANLYQDNGCNGGVDHAVMMNFGVTVNTVNMGRGLSWGVPPDHVEPIVKEANFPYLATPNSGHTNDNPKCQNLAGESAVMASNWKFNHALEGSPSTVVPRVIWNHGPVSIFMNATPEFQHFKSTSVFRSPNDDTQGVNHAMSIVGYGTKDGQDYWYLRNSWGAEWGDNGYARMEKNNSQTFRAGNTGPLNMFWTGVRYIDTGRAFNGRSSMPARPMVWTATKENFIKGATYDQRDVPAAHAGGEAGKQWCKQIAAADTDIAGFFWQKHPAKEVCGFYKGSRNPNVDWLTLAPCGQAPCKHRSAHLDGALFLKGHTHLPFNQWEWDCDYDADWYQNQPQYSQIDLTGPCSTGNCAANPVYGDEGPEEYCRSHCRDRLLKGEACKGIFYQQHRNGKEICGFYKATPVGKKYRSRSRDGATCLLVRHERAGPNANSAHVDGDDVSHSQDLKEADMDGILTTAAPTELDEERTASSTAPPATDPVNQRAYDCDSTVDWYTNQPPYSQQSLTGPCGSGDCAANPVYGDEGPTEYCIKKCIERGDYCKGFFFQEQSNGLQVCGFYYQTPVGNRFRSRNARGGAVCLPAEADDGSNSKGPDGTEGDDGTNGTDEVTIDRDHFAGVDKEHRDHFEDHDLNDDGLLTPQEFSNFLSKTE